MNDLESLIEHLPIFQINTASAILMGISLTSLFILMVILRPKTVLNKLAMWFCFCFMALVWRTVAAIFFPEFFGFRESLIASFIFLVATIVTTALGAVAWYEHVGDFLSHRREKVRGWHD
jgi:hypothetical protein